jgi:arylsulfatase A-like enzyme
MVRETDSSTPGGATATAADRRGPGGELTRRRFLQALLAGPALGLSCAQTISDDRPSFLVLLTDDQRRDTLGCMGNPVIQTPHLDALAARGVVFDQAFVTNSSCPSSRASILAGQYTRRHGVHDFHTPLSPASLAQTYPLLLRKHGYRTGFLGKWGLGGDLPWTAFDRFEGFPGQGTYFEEGDEEQRHLTGRLADRAIEFLREDRVRPFCLSVSFKAPHGPWTPDPALAHLYRDVEVPLSPTATLEAESELSAYLRGSMVGNRGRKWLSDPVTLQQLLRQYYRLITGVDVAVGRIVEAIELLGLSDRVVILFSSDNGLMVGEHGLVGKVLMHEESIRVPLIVNDPRVPGAGRRIQDIALNIDLAPTILDLAGIDRPSRMQGRSLVALMRGEDPDWRDDFFYEAGLAVGKRDRRAGPSPYFPSVEGVRSRDWKYMRYLDAGSPGEQLYDLRSDSLEIENLVDREEHRDVLETLRQRWSEYRALLT